MPSFDVTIKAEVTLTVEAPDHEAAEAWAFEDVHRSPSPLWRGISEVKAERTPATISSKSADS